MDNLIYMKVRVGLTSHHHYWSSSSVWGEGEVNTAVVIIIVHHLHPSEGRRGRLIRPFQGSQECHYCHGGALEVAKRSYPPISPPHNYYYHIIIITITIITITILRRPSTKRCLFYWPCSTSLWGYLEFGYFYIEKDVFILLKVLYKMFRLKFFVGGRKFKYQHQNHQRHHIVFMIPSVCQDIWPLLFLAQGLDYVTKAPQGETIENKINFWGTE